MLLLSAEDPTRDIALYINSPGGSVTAGMAIYDTMKFVPCDVATYGMGLAASMGQFLLSAGTPGKRYALPHARIMMHQPSAGIGGTASDIKIQAEQMLHIKKQMAELIAEHTGQTVEQIEKDSDRDRWFTAQEAKEALNFTLPPTAVAIVANLLALLPVVGGIFGIIAVVIWLFMTVSGVNAGIQCNKGRPYRYPLNLRLIH